MTTSCRWRNVGVSEIGSVRGSNIMFIYTYCIYTWIGYLYDLIQEMFISIKLPVVPESATIVE